MQLLLKGLTITDTLSPHNHSVKDIRIQNGFITEISDQITAKADEEVFDYTGKYISPGWFDMLAHFADPGLEQKEDLDTGALAAGQGGFTSVCCMPHTHPALHSKAEIEYIIHKNKGNIVSVLPLAAVTKNCAGNDLTEMYDMRTAGAVAFTDAAHAIRDAGILMRALQYVKPFNGTIINIPNDHAIVGNANVHEGVMSMQLGMYGIPSVLEELMVIRDIKLVEYTNSKLHIACVSTKESVEQIRIAKQKGINISASVSAYQLYFDESELSAYDTTFKVNPPLRTKEDIAALKKGLVDGTIDTICSYHLPHELDAKDVEFEYAADGMETLEATFGAALYALDGFLSVEKIIKKLTVNPRNNVNIPPLKIAAGERAELTIFDTQTEWVFLREHIRSRSTNNPFIGKPLKGKALAIINNNQIKTVNNGNKS
ncbi:MAG: dihydroorotase [Chitinophagales bacterium]|nr:dihydroorotase [Chitinophagales bacterium]